MSFYKYGEKGKKLRYKKAVVDCSNDKIIVEQQHKDEVNINAIVKRHAGNAEAIAKIGRLQQPQFDDLPNNDFQEAMQAVTKAQQTFQTLNSDIRKRFNNDPSQFMDYIHNPENQDSLIEMGLATRRPPNEVINVNVTNEAIRTRNSETPATPAAE